jgi:hypothetical protein
MVQTKFSVVFILQAAAIALVAALPLPVDENDSIANYIHLASDPGSPPPPASG